MTTPNIEVNLARARVFSSSSRPSSDEETRKFVIPGDIVTQHIDLIRGHGTYVDQRDNERVLRSSVAGTVSCVNKLISVYPQKTRYNGEIGNIVVGRVVEVSQRRWKIDVKAKLDAILLLSSVNLPSGEIRRKSEEDEKWMKDYLSDTDLICAEVHALFNDGSLSLSMRGDKLGKLGQGVLVNVSPSLVKDNKVHFHSMTCGATVITGSNGYIWISPSKQYLAEGLEEQGQVLEPFPREDHEKVARIRACLLALSETKTPIYDMTMTYAYDASLCYEIKELQKPEIQKELTDATRKLLVENSWQMND